MRLALTPRADTTTRDAATDVCSHDGCEPIRVCFLTPSLVMGGAERWMLSLARYCNPERIQWAGTVITRYAAVKPEITSQLSSCMPIAGPPERGESDSADVVRCPSLTDAVEQVVRDADVMVAWGVPDIGQLTGRLSIPIVYVSHGAGDWTARALRSSEADCSHFAAVSQTAVSPFSQQVQPQVKVLHNGIETDRCRVETSRPEFRRRWNIPETATVIGYVGRYSYEKFPLAAALAVRHIDRPDVVALFCGEGWRKADVVSDVKSLIGDRAIFLPYQENVGDVLNGIDVCMAASPAEGFSLAITEAWYCEVPCVSTRVGSVPELEKRFGQLAASVPVHASPSELVAGTQEALSSRFLEDCVPRAKAMVCEHFTAEKMAERWEDYLISIVRPAETTTSNT